MRSDRYVEESKHGKSDGSGQKPRKKRKTLRTVLILILLLAAAIAGLVAYSYKTAKDSIALTFTDNDFTVEFGESHAAADYVRSAEGEVSCEPEMLETTTTGEKEIVYTVTKSVLGGLLKPSGQYTLRYTVVDSIPPVMIRSGDGTVLERGTEFDIDLVISYGDNADPKPDLKVDGDVDMSANGSYPLHVKVTDASGNETEWDLSVEVADSVPVYQDDSPRVGFADFVKKYAGGGKTFGIDVSEWQHDIDFKAVKNTGCEFVIIRIGYNKEDGFTYDSKFEYNIKAAKEAGLKVGLYMFSYDNSAETLKAATDLIRERLEGEELDLPIAFDWEDFAAFQTYEMSFYDLNRLYDVFAEEMGKSGYDTMLYGSLIFLNGMWTGKDTRPIWVAQYADELAYKGKYLMWQASSSGRIAGIDGDVDLDILMP